MRGRMTLVCGFVPMTFLGDVVEWYRHSLVFFKLGRVCGKGSIGTHDCQIGTEIFE